MQHSTIAAIATAPGAGGIAIVRLSGGIKTIAEGVEDKEQSQILKNLGCDEIQGYYYSKPIKDEDYYNKLS